MKQVYNVFRFLVLKKITLAVVRMIQKETIVDVETETITVLQTEIIITQIKMLVMELGGKSTY